MFGSHLSASRLLEIAQVKLSQDITVKDRAVWMDGKKAFRVKDAYNLAMERDSATQWEGWSLIWKLKKSAKSASLYVVPSS